MKTRPVPDLLPLPLSDDLAKMLAVCHDAIHEMVCYGTHILAISLKKNQSAQVVPNESAVAVPLLFRHVLELLDSISIQIKAGVIVPSKLQLRAILDVFFGLEYLLEDKADIEFKSHCYFLVDFYKDLNQLRKHIPCSEENKEYMEEMRKDRFYRPEMFNKVEARAQERSTDLSKLINRPDYEEAKRAYNDYTRNNTKKLDSVKWYNLSGGPESIFALAEHLKLRSIYDSLYKSYSNPIHGSKLSNGVLERGADGFGTFNQLRVLYEFKDITELTLGVGLDLYALMVKNVIPKEQAGLERWIQAFNDSHLNQIRRIVIRSADVRNQADG